MDLGALESRFQRVDSNIGSQRNCQHGQIDREDFISNVQYLVWLVLSTGKISSDNEDFGLEWCGLHLFIGSDQTLQEHSICLKMGSGEILRERKHYAHLLWGFDPEQVPLQMLWTLIPCLSHGALHRLLRGINQWRTNISVDCSPWKFG